MEVYDPDESGSIEVEFTSDSDVDSETIVLDEVSEGLFRGSIPVENVGFELLSDEDRARLLPAKINQLRSIYPDLEDRQLELRAEAELKRETIARYESGDMDDPGTRDDGILQIRAGDVIVVSYYDTLNDFGSEEEVTDQAVYGGWIGGVSGTWTADNSPYVVTGDLYLNGDLTIEPGVEVLFFDNYSFVVYGWDGNLTAEGTETDSIYFKPLNEGGVWDGLNLYYGGNHTLSYVDMSMSNDQLVRISSLEDGDIKINNSKFHNSNYALGLWDGYNPGGSITIDSCEFNGNNEGAAVEIFYMFNQELLHEGCPLLITNSSITNYSIGLYLYEVSICAEYNTITNNDQGIYLYETHANFDNIRFNYNNIHDNEEMDVSAGCCGNENEEFDFKYNYWGEETTNEMNEGDNPKNISKIYDWWDHDGNGPMVNYAGWEQSEIGNLLGDLNGDSSIDVLDIVIIVDNILESGDLYYDEQADMNGDGAINIQDLIIIIFDFILEN